MVLCRSFFHPLNSYKLFKFFSYRFLEKGKQKERNERLKILEHEPIEEINALGLDDTEYKMLMSTFLASRHHEHDLSCSRREERKRIWQLRKEARRKVRKTFVMKLRLMIK